MRLRRLELAVIALTLAFGCFMGGYFTGRRGSVNVLTVAPQNGGMQMVATVAPSPPAIEAPPPAADTADKGAADAPGDSGAGAGASGEAPAAQLPASPIPDNRSAAPAVNDSRININLASQAELMDLPGIGNVLAGRIVDYRQKNGPFSRIEDIRNVSGIGEKRFIAIQDMISIG